MNIEVRLFATFREGREKKYFLEVAEGTRIIDIINRFEIDKKEASIVLVNGIDGSLDRVLNDGDVLALFPPVGGG